MSASEHIVIAGYSRSGSTMLYNMLRNSVSGFNFFDREMPAAKAISEHHNSSFSKYPPDIFNLDSIFKNNVYRKDVSLIILIRDIRSIITSYHEAVPDDYFIAYDWQYAPGYNGELSYSNRGVIPTANAIHKAIRNPNFKTKVILRYEDLIIDPKKQQDRLAKLLQIRFHDDLSNFHTYEIPSRLTRQLNGIREVERSRLRAWKRPEHAQRIRSQFTRCPKLFDLLISYGYEKSREWFAPYRRRALTTENKV